jgi:hypothetical protein
MLHCFENTIWWGSLGAVGKWQEFHTLLSCLTPIVIALARILIIATTIASIMQIILDASTYHVFANT